MNGHHFVGLRNLYSWVRLSSVRVKIGLGLGYVTVSLRLALRTQQDSLTYLQLNSER